MRSIAFICFFCLSILLNAQSAQKKFHDLSKPERHWVLSHPFIAKRTFHLTQRVLVVCDSMKKDSMLDGDGNGGELDAFRHAYWMVLLCQHIDPKKAYKLGEAHEKGNRIAFLKGEPEDNTRPDSISCIMDLVNDQLGIEIGLGNKKSIKPLSDDELIDVVKDQLLKGNLRKLFKDDKGDFVTRDLEVIDLNAYKGKWYIPKFMVRSNAKWEGDGY